MFSRIKFILPLRRHTAIHKIVTNPRERFLTYRPATYTATSASNQMSPSRGYKSYASIPPTMRRQEFPKVVEANKGSGIKQPDSRGYQPRKINCSVQPQELQQTSTTMGLKDPAVFSGKINKCSQNNITTSSNPDIKYTSSTSESNVTCGSCGGKGHTRKWKSCPNYYTEKESARREVHGERRRQKIQMFFIIKAKIIPLQYLQTLTNLIQCVKNL